MRPSTPSSIVLRNAHGRLSLATPGFEEACEVATIFISLATGKVTSAALLVSGTCDRQHLVVTGELAQIVGGLRGLGGVVKNDDVQLCAVDAAAVIDLLLQHLQRHRVGAAPFGERPAARHDGAERDLGAGLLREHCPAARCRSASHPLRRHIALCSSSTSCELSSHVAVRCLTAF